MFLFVFDFYGENIPGEFLIWEIKRFNESFLFSVEYIELSWPSPFYNNDDKNDAVGDGQSPREIVAS